MAEMSDTKRLRLEDAVRSLTSAIEEMGAASLLLAISTIYGKKYVAVGTLSRIIEIAEEQQVGELTATYVPANSNDHYA